MSLIATKCPSCGGEIQLDDQREKGFCLYCGSQIDIQKTLNPERPNITGSEQDIMNWKSAYDKYMKEFMYDKAEQMADKIMQANPNDPDAIYRYKAVIDAPKLNINKEGDLNGFIDLNIIDEDGYKVNPFEKIEELYIPHGVKCIKEEAFMGYKRLKQVYIPDGLISIDRKAFVFCYYLEVINIPASVINIGDYAFSGCDHLLESLIPNTVTNVGKFIFKNYSNEVKKEVMEIIKTGLKEKGYLVLPGDIFGMTSETIIIRENNIDLQLKPITSINVYKGRLSYEDSDLLAEVCNALFQRNHFGDSDKEELKCKVINDMLEVLWFNKFIPYSGESIGMPSGTLIVKTEMVDLQIKSIYAMSGINRYDLLEAEGTESFDIIKKLEEEHVPIMIEKTRKLEIEEKEKNELAERRRNELSNKIKEQEIIMQENRGIFGESARKRKEAEQRINEIKNELANI